MRRASASVARIKPLVGHMPAVNLKAVDAKDRIVRLAIEPSSPMTAAENVISPHESAPTNALRCGNLHGLHGALKMKPALRLSNDAGIRLIDTSRAEEGAGSHKSVGSMAS